MKSTNYSDAQLLVVSPASQLKIAAKAVSQAIAMTLQACCGFVGEFSSPPMT